MAWTLYKEVKYDTLGIPPGDLTDFPVPVWIDTDADIASELGGGGGVKFTSADGMTDLDFGLYPTSNLAAGTVHARVKISPDADASVGDVAMRIYYSSGESSPEDKAGTVDNDYALFMPLEEDPSGSAPQMLDWVSNSNVGTSAGSMTSGDLVTGTVGNQLDFDGSNDYIDCGSPLGTGAQGAITLEAIISRSSSSHHASVGFTDSNANRFNFLWWTGGQMFFNFKSDFEAYSDGGLTGTHYWAYVFEGGHSSERVRGYLDGTKVFGYNPAVVSYTPSTDKFVIGAELVNSRFSTAQVDEVKLSTVARSADWLAYSYTTDFNLSDLWTLGAEQGGGGGGGGNRRRRFLLAAA